MKLVSSNQMRSLEQRADVSGNSYATMMERAGRSVADAIVSRFEVRSRNGLVLVGPGNNGGDGLVCARYLHDIGVRVSLYIWKRSSEADENFRLCRERNIPTTYAEDDRDFSELMKRVHECDVIVDALLGTGVARPIAGTLKDLLEAVNDETRKLIKSHITSVLPSKPRHSHTRIVAVDLPSGLNPDTGALDPATLYADLTVTFAFPKIGQLLFPGANSVGELLVADIGIPEEWASEVNVQVATAQEIAARLPARPSDSHKGTFGKALVCAGSLHYTGAAFLAGSAATRAGAGLVTLALARTIYPIVASAAHETTFVPLPDANGSLISTASKIVQEYLKDYDALLIGPGFGRDERTIAFVRALLGLDKKSRASIRPQVPLIIDADALFALAQTWKWWTRIAPGTAIVTPHPGEMATLCGLSRDTIQADRIGIAGKFAKEWRQVVVLKGAHSVVAEPTGRVTLIPFATPALATAGTGDVLAGTIVAMLAQGLEPHDAAILGTYLHGLAGKIAEEEIGEAGVVAGDLLTRLPKAITETRQVTASPA